MAEIAEKHGHSSPPRESDGWKRTRLMCANLLFHGLQAKPGLRHKIPTLYIEACLHAAIRWDKARRLVGNDIYDFNHASAAIAHCQAFFTEGPLKALLASKHHGLADDFGCRIASDIPEAADILGDLVRYYGGQSSALDSRSRSHRKAVDERAIAEPNGLNVHRN
jgi:hypothetical protein